MARACLIAVDGQSAPAPEALLRELARAGVELVREGDGSGTSLYIVFFARPGPAVLEALGRLRHDPWARVLAMAAHPDVLANGFCWELLQAGASEVLAWDRPAEDAATAAARLARWQAVDERVRSPEVQGRLIGRSSEWIRTLREVVEVGAFTSSSVLVVGESGTGKEEVARLIHELDSRPDKGELVTLDCATVVPELSGSEFFGHERGAFTGAIGQRDGAFALAQGGTLFLDEVGELPLGLQAQLLRAVQERTFKRVGGNSWQRVSFRLICATNRDLAEEMAKGGFRRDFYHRIASWVCRLPPLRERVSDLEPLIERFIEQACPEEPPLKIDPAVRDYLLRRDYPGNVRELRQLVLRICGRHVGRGAITVGDLPQEELAAAWPVPGWQDGSFAAAIQRALLCGASLKELGRVTSETAIRLAVAAEEGNLQRAARRLGVTDRALQLRRAQQQT
ncbi:MAG: sigma-54-dependent Fis family transcriptional regulator [Deltaproteobacteria bacterium]|nr:sigma-54-dependent Fis family transcriptional regulator [Deltaproteobacteria bacterium]